MIKEALWVGCDGMDGIGMVIIGRRYSKSTFSANNRNELQKAAATQVVIPQLADEDFVYFCVGH